jgi:hypothetical protein
MTTAGVETPSSQSVTISRDFRITEKVFSIIDSRKDDTVAGAIDPTSIIPGYGDVSYFNEDDGSFFDATVVPGPSGYTTVTLRYRRRIWDRALYQISHRCEKIPLSKNSAYLYNWDHELWAASTAAEPAWWATAEDESDTISSTYYRWAKASATGAAPAGMPPTYKLMKAATKPSSAQLGGFLHGSAKVTKRKAYTDKTAAQRLVSEVGLLLKPAELFGASDVQGCWLLSACDVQQEDDGWATTCEFLLSDYGWNVEAGDPIYAASTEVDDP